MNEDKELVREFKRSIKKDQILKFISSNKKVILLALSIIVIIIISYVAQSLYYANKSNKNSIVFAEVQEHIIQNNLTEAYVLLDKLIQSGTSGYVFLSYVEKATLLVKEGKAQEAIEVLKDGYNKASIPSYYKDMLLNMQFMLRANNSNSLDELAIDVKNALNKKSKFYFNNLEIYISLLVEQKNYAEANVLLQEIIESPDVSGDIKERSKRIKSVISSYINF